MTEDDTFWEQVSEKCGAIFEIDAIHLMMFGEEEPIRKIPTVELVCTLDLGHTPANKHSDGVNDWLGDEYDGGVVP